MKKSELEYRRYCTWAYPAQSAVWKFLLRRSDGKTTLQPFEHELVHGTPTDGLCSMLEKGFQPQPHGLIDGKWLCVSPNNEMLRHFGEMPGQRYNGFYAEKCRLENVLWLEEVHLTFLWAICSDAIPRDIRPDWLKVLAEPKYRKLIKWLIRHQWLTEDGDLLDSYRDYVDVWENFPPFIDGLVWPSCYQTMVNGYFICDDSRNEAEISLSAHGAKRFQEQVTTVFLEGKEYPLEEAKARLLNIAA